MITLPPVSPETLLKSAQWVLDNPRFKADPSIVWAVDTLLELGLTVPAEIAAQAERLRSERELRNGAQTKRRGKKTAAPTLFDGDAADGQDASRL
jgi:hypothetical protein